MKQLMDSFLAFLLTACSLLCCAVRLCAQPQCVVTHFDEFSGMAQWYVTQIVQDRQGMMWFATWNGLNRYDGYQFDCFKSQVGDGIDMPSDRIQDMMLDDDGNLLCLVEGRVFRFDVRTCRYHAFPPDQEKAMAARFDAKPSSNRYAVGQLYHPETPIDQDVYYCTTDRQQNVWLKSHYGAYRLSFKRKPYTAFPQEKPTQTRYFFLDSHQRYWVTTKEDATVRLFDGDNRLLGYLGRDGRLHPQYVSFGSPVYCMTQDAAGQYWLGSKPDGLFRLREDANGTFRIAQFRHQPDDRQSLSNDQVVYLKPDRQGRLWVATFDGGLACIEHPQDEQPRFLHKDNGLRLPKDSFLRVRQVHITDDDILLAATTTGLLVADISQRDLSRTVWHHHVKDSRRTTSLSNNATMFVAEDSRHRIFICTESGGVNQIVSEHLLDPQLRFRHYDMSAGLPSDVALSAFAADDYVLIVSNNQLIQLFPDRQGDDLYRAFFWKDRLRFSDAEPLRLPDGRHLFGLQDGAFTIRLADIRKSDFVPPIALTGLSVENGPVRRAVNAMDTLTLQPPERNFTIWFAALDYSEGATISYAFQMGDEQDQWNFIHSDHSATFLDLRPGTYQLHIRSTNGDGLWVDNQRTLTVVVVPTFWETPWAQLLYTLLIVAVIWFFVWSHRYVKRIKRQQRETYEAYLALLNTQPAAPAAEPVPAETPPAAESIAKLKPEDDAFMQRAMKFIEEHLSDSDINIGDMADATATSRSGLNRKMRSLLGVTPLDFIREARIRRACQLLREGATVNDVAYACGFSDPKYFGKCFKAEMGMTPTEYKSQS